MHNDLGLTEPVDISVRPYFDRPYRVIGAGRFVASLLDTISADEIRRLPPTGAVDQFIDSTDAAGDLRLLRAAISVQLGGWAASPTLCGTRRPRPAAEFCTTPPSLSTTPDR